MALPVTPVIAVVDDEAVVVSLTCDALESEGYIVHPFTQPQSALDFLHDHPVDLIITDIRMPQLSGIELIARARAVQSDLVVIFMTGYATLGSAKDAIKHGAADYIMKPFELHELRLAVAKVLREKQESASRQASQELSKLTNLGDLLFSSSDQDSIVDSSLRFAMNHLQSSQAGILVVEEQTATNYSSATKTPTSTDGAAARKLLADMVAMQLREAIVVSRSSEPFRSVIDDAASRKLLPVWVTQVDDLVVTPVPGTDGLRGVLIVPLTSETIRMNKGQLSVLSIVSRQLGMMLENLSLLRKTQHAFARLNELQDQTIELERLATRGQLSAEIGHELNNFLSVVAGSVSLVELYCDKQQYDALGKPLEAINRTISKMTRFTSDLMNHSGGQSQKEPLHLDRLLRDVVDSIRPQKRFRGIQITAQIGATDVVIVGDQTQLQQVLYNLLNNAADAMLKSDWRELTIALRADSLQAHQVVVTIQDRGVGMSPEILAKAFTEKFTTKENGHGFGLIVCRRLIESHGGTLIATSVAGSGTTMTITLPLATGVEAAASAVR